MWWLWLILILSACFGSWWFYQRLQNTSDKKNLLYLRICVGVVAFLFLVQLGSCLFSGGYDSGSREIVKDHLEYAGEYVGDYILNHKLTGKKTGVLIIDYPDGTDFPGAEYSKVVIDGIDTSFKNNKKSKEYICGVVRPRIDETAKNYWLSCQEWDRIIDEHSEAGVVVSLVGLPKELKKMKSWLKKDAPKIILFKGKLKFLKKCFKYKLIVAALIAVPGQNIKNEKIPEEGLNPAVLKKYFIWVTPSNLDRIVKKYPSMF